MPNKEKLDFEQSMTVMAQFDFEEEDDNIETNFTEIKDVIHT